MIAVGHNFYGNAAASMRELFRTPPYSDAAGWAEETVYIPPGLSNRPGRLDLNVTPWVREWINAYADPSTREMAIVCGAQVAKTLFQMLCMGYTIDCEPAPSLVVFPTEVEARSFSKTRFMQVAMASKALRAKFDGNGADVTYQEMMLPGMTLNFVGSNSPARLASRPIARLNVDEVDKLGDASEEESSALNLVRNRIRSFGRRGKIVLTSTPTIPQGPIWQEYLNGDRRKFMLPFPCCGRWQELKWKNIRYPGKGRAFVPKRMLERIQKDAAYYCEGCGEQFTDKMKRDVLPLGRWEQTAAGAPGVKSYQLSGLYPPWAEFGGLAVEHARKKATAEGLHDFKNSVLGLPVRIKAENADAGELASHKMGYDIGECPEEPVEIVMTADAQKNETFFWLVRAWCGKEQSYLLDFGRASSKAELREISKRRYRTPIGDYAPTRRLIDAGAFTDDIYQFCDADPSNRWTPIKGVEKREARTPADPQGKRKDGRPLLIVHTHYCRQALAAMIARPKGHHGYWGLPARVDQEYFRHMTAERAVEVRDKNNRPRIEWQQVEGRDNHWWDCEVYQACAARLLNVLGKKTRLGVSK